MTQPFDPRTDVADLDLLRDAALRVAQMRGPDAERHRPGLETWLAADPEHRAAFNRMTEVFTLGKGLRRDAELPDRRRSPLRREAALAGVVALLLVVGVGGIVLKAPERIAGDVMPHRRLETAVRRYADAAPRVIRLSDGSVVVLDRGAEIETAFSDEKRVVRLTSGRARFDVAHEARPFTVLAGGGSVTAHGTLFDVGIVGGRIDVHLIRGVVDVAAVSDDGRRHGERVLYAGDGATISKAGTVRLPATGEPDDWASAVIDVDGATLSEVVAQANARSATRISLIDGATAARRVSGRFHIDDPDRLASRLSELFDLRETRSGPGDIKLQSSPRGTR